MTIKIEIPSQVKKDLYVDIDTRFGSISIRDFDITKLGNMYAHNILIAKVPITIDIDQDINLDSIRSKLVANLQRHKDDIKAEYHMKIQDVENQIQNLLAIEYNQESTQV